jgi:hypothetical protein
MALVIHTKLFGKRDPKTKEMLDTMLTEAHKD